MKLHRFSYYRIILEYYKALFNRSLKNKMKKILSYNENNLNLRKVREYTMPGFKEYKSMGYYKYMLGRYLSALNFCQNKRVLDTGCGLGWGPYLIADYCSHITGIDKDEDAITFAKNNWKSKNLEFLKGSFLNLSSFLRKGYDVVLGMETIEHNTYENGKKYLQEIDCVLKRKGILILTSIFPDSEKKAEMIRKENPHHLHIFTKKEITSILSEIGCYKSSFKADLMLTAKKL